MQESTVIKEEPQQPSLKEKQEPAMKEKKELFCLSYSKNGVLSNYSDSALIKGILFEFINSSQAFDLFLKEIGLISPLKFKILEPFRQLNLFGLIKTLNKRILVSEENKPSFPQNLESRIQGEKLVLTYQILSQIVDYLLFILNRAITQNAETEIESFLNRGTLNSFYVVKVNEKELKINFFWRVSSLDIKISDSTSNDSINLDKVVFFALFYNSLFPNTNHISFDLNISKLDDIYMSDTNPYKMRRVSIENISKNFAYCIIANYILLNKISQKNKINSFNLKVFDDYILEMETVLWSQLDTLPNSRMSRELTHMLFFSHLYLLSKLHFFECSFNALDKLLFQRILFIFFKNDDITGFSIRLFQSAVNKRKILLNNMVSDRKDEESVESSFKHFDILHREKYDWNHKDQNVIKDEFILDLLFNDFNLNLTRLLVLIQKKSKVQVMVLNCVLPEEIRQKLNYSYSIGYFIYNLFNIFVLKAFQIKLTTLDVSSNVDLPDEFFKSSFVPITISSLNISQLRINLKNISRFINLDDLPAALTLLSLTSMSYEDLCRFAQGIQKKRYGLDLLKEMSIEINYTKPENYQEPLKQLMMSLPDNLVKFKYRMKCYTDDALIVNTINYLIKLQNVEDKFFAECHYFVPEFDEDDADKTAWLYMNNLKKKIRREADATKKNCFKFSFDEPAKNQLSIVILKYSINSNMTKQYNWLDKLITNIYKKHNTFKETDSNMLTIYSILGFLNIPYQRLMIKLVFNKDVNS